MKVNIEKCFNLGKKFFICILIYMLIFLVSMNIISEYMFMVIILIPIYVDIMTNLDKL